jgi:hypothetical protein
MVKNRSAKILALAIGAVLLRWAGILVAGGKAVKVPFNATEIMLGPVGPEYLGTMTYPDGNYHVRDQSGRFRWIYPPGYTPEPRLSGEFNVVVNMNLDSPPDYDDPGAIASGPMWGTFNFPIGRDSRWDGSWHGLVFDLVKTYSNTAGLDTAMDNSRGCK